MNDIRIVSKSFADKQQHVELGLEAIRDALLGLQFGSVTVTMHEDRIVQIDVTEKKRLTSKN